MPISQEEILNALRTVRYPGYTRDIVSFGFVKEIRAHDGRISVSLELSSNDPKAAEELKAAVTLALKPFEKDGAVEIDFSLRETTPAQAKTGSTRIALPNIKCKIAIASGKGGVGKSTVAVNLAYALHKILNARVGILDCDVYGPTVPLMLGARGDPMMENGQIMPFEAHGLKLMSMGLLIDENTPVIWRGPMITKAIHQFSSQVNWGELDCLVIDLPPGTGDAQLSLTQMIALDGVLIVTTPQSAAAQVAARGAQMFAKVDVPILGVIENMSFYPIITDNGQVKKEYPFGQGGGRFVASELNVPLLAELPIDSRLRELADKGQPVLAFGQDGVSAKLYIGLAEEVSKLMRAR